MGSDEHRLGHQYVPKRLSSGRTLPPCSVPGRQIVFGSFAVHQYLLYSEFLAILGHLLTAHSCT